MLTSPQKRQPRSAVRPATKKELSKSLSRLNTSIDWPKPNEVPVKELKIKLREADPKDFSPPVTKVKTRRANVSLEIEAIFEEPSFEIFAVQPKSVPVSPRVLVTPQFARNFGKVKIQQKVSL